MAIIALDCLLVFVASLLTCCRCIHSYNIHAARISHDGSALLFDFVILHALSCATITLLRIMFGDAGIASPQRARRRQKRQEVGVISRKFEDRQH